MSAVIAIDLTKPLKELLEDYDACKDGQEWAKSHQTAAAAWEACENPEWMLWALDQIGYGDTEAGKSKLRLFACACVRETPLPDGRKVWDLLTDERSKQAVEVSERFANGAATQEELAAALAAAWDAAWAAARAAALAAARAAAWAAARAAALAAAWDAARAAACDAARAAARAAAWAAACDAARAAQAKLLRRFVGNPFSK